jgi:hypothetical protein
MLSAQSFPNSVRTCACLCAAALLLASCAGQQEPAQKMISDIETLVNASAADAAQYAPDQLQDVQSKLGDLRASFDKHDYKAVVSGAPPVLAAAESLAGAAAAKKDEVTKALDVEWTTFASTLPANAAAIQSRIDFLSRKENKKLASGVDLDAARTTLGSVTALWTKAQAAFSAGSLAEAVTTAKSANTSLDALAASMKLDFKQPAAVRDTSPGG